MHPGCISGLNAERMAAAPSRCRQAAGAALGGSAWARLHFWFVCGAHKQSSEAGMRLAGIFWFVCQWASQAATVNVRTEEAIQMQPCLCADLTSHAAVPLYPGCAAIRVASCSCPNERRDNTGDALNDPGCAAIRIASSSSYPIRIAAQLRSYPDRRR